MTTTTRQDRTPGPSTATPVSDTTLTPPPRLRRRPGLVVGAVDVTTLGCLLGAWAWNASTSTHEVLAATRTIHRGEVITARDVRRVQIGSDSGLKPLPSSAYDDAVGHRAALDISSGGLLTAESTTESPMPPADKSVVGISLTPGQLPAVAMHGGDKVRIIVTPSADGDAIGGAPDFTVAEVVSTSTDERCGARMRDSSASFLALWEARNTWVTRRAPPAEAG